jgi:hypothetical protein
MPEQGILLLPFVMRRLPIVLNYIFLFAPKTNRRLPWTANGVGYIFN